ncbi:short-chain dehydrogenase [Aspergillus luchuensis]|uniref:Short-chain dehydrogenase n=1 Tax=Aspergillus kawachii TaxID=1069201 RepID=A0A146F669_ASPKA|nr:short-chain dehydrogenase [Aspergillus luchuensis]
MAQTIKPSKSPDSGEPMCQALFNANRRMGRTGIHSVNDLQLKGTLHGLIINPGPKRQIPKCGRSGFACWKASQIAGQRKVALQTGAPD